MRSVNGYGRWFWGLSGLATAAALALPGVKFFVHAGQGFGPGPFDTVNRTMIVSENVTSVNLDTQSASLRIVTQAVPKVRVTEQITYVGKRSQAHVVPPVVSHGQLTFPDSGCCVAGYTLVVPPKMTVSATTEGGQVSISGTAATMVDSGGGPVMVSQIHGPLNIHAEGGNVTINGLAGSFRVDTGGGSLFATNIRATYLFAYSEGGNASIWLSTAPETVVADTGGGNAMLSVPDGPYALTADAAGGPESLQVNTSQSAARTITVNTEGGSLSIMPPGNQAVK